MDDVKRMVREYVIPAIELTLLIGACLLCYSQFLKYVDNAIERDINYEETVINKYKNLK